MNARRNRVLETAALLAGLVIANYIFRRYLEHAPIYLWSFVDAYYRGVIERLVATAPWRLFLPIPAMTGSWATTTLVVSHLLEPWILPWQQWLLFNAILILASYAISWWVFRSRVFSATFAMLMGFGTALYDTYAVSGTIPFPLLFVYYELLIAAAVKVVFDGARPVAVLLFTLGTLLTALAYEGWLDLLVFTWGAALLGAWLLWRSGRMSELRRLVVLESALTVVGVLYIVIKVYSGYGQSNGSESDVVFNYPVLAPMVEDVVSNLLTHLYIGLTAFLPPMFLSSASLVQVGPEKLIALQHDYHAGFSYLVPMHYLFLWRYAAGAAFVVYLYALVKAVRGAALGSRDAAAVVVFLIMIATGGPTHALVKFRPMNSAPVLTYHVMVGVLGCALLISYGALVVWRDFRNRRMARLVVAAIWAVALYASFARPPYLSAMAAQAGLGEGLFPDPLRAAAHVARIDLPTPPGEKVYQLERVPPQENAIGLVAEGNTWLPPLSTPLPPPSEWRPASPDASVRVVENTLVVRGDTSQLRYQVVSPRLIVPADRRVTFRIRLHTDAPRVCTGVLDEAETRWALLPRVGQELTLNSGANTKLTLVIANCNARQTENDHTQFTLYGGSYEVGGAR